MIHRLIVLLLLHFSLAWAVPVPAATLEKGILDAADWDPLLQPRLKLQGEWRFYTDRFLTAEDMATIDSLPFILLKMPGPSWEEAGYR
ncbi:MAG: hypothetical protein M3Q07_14400, partial [Pseudobdellovibrionaceae bacterium]|nr:hypothetical protein [Pseudobdellovibrionaceae bacterium]